jgi:hypothetical protein
MPLAQKPPRVPPPGTVFVDGKGRLTPEAHDFLMALIRYLERLRALLADEN